MKPLIKTVLALSLLLLILQFFQDTLVFKRDNINLGEWWRLLSGNFVHTNYPHLALNISGLLICGFLFFDYISPRKFLASLIFLCVCVGLGIYYFSPALMWYAGISGALYGLFIVGGFFAIIHKDFVTGIPLVVLIPIKIIWDLYHGGNQSSAELIGAPVATEAHLYGMIGAFIIGLFILISRNWQRQITDDIS
jgi:rhomboid family GlyGly-CTERM serine protease